MSISQLETLSFLSAANSGLYRRTLREISAEPASVDKSWAVLFSGLGDDAKAIIAELQGASWRPSSEKLAAVLSTPSNIDDAVKPSAKKEGKAAPAASAASVTDSLRAFLLIRSYQVRGHLLANLDPLGLMQRNYHPELDPKTYGFTEADYDRPSRWGRWLLASESATLRQIMQHLQETYCGAIGVEFMHIQIPAQKAWLMERFEQKP